MRGAKGEGPGWASAGLSAHPVQVPHVPVDSVSKVWILPLEGTAGAVDPDSCSELQLLSFMGLSICGEIPGL